MMKMGFFRASVADGRPATKRSSPRTRRPALERLEPRRLLAAVVMSDWEQLLLELVNRARSDPPAEASRYGISLNDGLSPGTISADPKQPLAPHQALVDAAVGHSQDMLDRDFFAHNTPDGKTPWQRIRQAGYDYRRAAENIAWMGSTGALDRDASVLELHEGLFQSAGHRENLLGPEFRELGTGVRFGVFTESGANWNAAMATENFGATSHGPFITGVVYRDTVTADKFYSIGEGIGSVTVSARNVSTQVVYTTQSGASGGYALEIPAGTYTVTAEGGTLPNVMAVTDVVVSSQNRKVDFDASRIVNSSPTAILLDDRDVPERLVGAVVGKIEVLDPDFGDEHQYVVSDPRFEVADGKLRLRQMQRLLRDDEPTVQLDVTVTDAGGLTMTERFQLTVTQHAAPWQNSPDFLDVDGDGTVAPVDVLLIVNRLNGVGPGPVPDGANSNGGPYLDTSGDNYVSPADSLLVLNHLNTPVTQTAAAYLGVRDVASADRTSGDVRNDERRVEKASAREVLNVANSREAREQLFMQWAWRELPRGRSNGRAGSPRFDDPLPVQLDGLEETLTTLLGDW